MLWSVQATAAVTLVPAESLQKAPATKKEPKKEEQLTTAHLKQVDFNINLDKVSVHEPHSLPALLLLRSCWYVFSSICTI